MGLALNVTALFSKARHKGRCVYEKQVHFALYGIFAKVNERLVCKLPFGNGAFLSSTPLKQDLVWLSLREPTKTSL